jgi:adenine-specific DNA methylase
MADAIIECVALAVSNSLQFQCNITTYPSERAGFISAFIQGQSLPMKMDFVEVNPLVKGLAGGLEFTIDQHLSGLDFLAETNSQEGTATSASALKHVLPADSADCLVTDPPYYDLIPFADCSDFFYVWLRRMLVGISSFSSSTALVPKSEEIAQLAERNERYREKTKDWFEARMSDALANMRSVVHPEGLGVILFAHKETAAWEAMLQSVLNAGWIVTSSWPIDTENANRMRASESATLSSTVHIACRPRENCDGSVRANEVGDWRDVLHELAPRIHEWMPRLAEEGVVGADAIFACLGPALEIFSRYSRVEKANGEAVTLREYLESVWAAVAKEALTMIFTGADATGFEGDARLSAMWLWTLSTSGPDASGSSATSEDDAGEEDEPASESGKGKVGGFVLEYDAARKIAQGLGADLGQLTSLIEVKGASARLLPVAERTSWLFQKGDGGAPASRGRPKKKSDQLSMGFVAELEEAQESGGWGETGLPRKGETVLDRVHQSMILFGAGRSEALKRFLVEDGVGRDDHFWRLAQAFSALYPAATDEKRWVDGVLARKKGLGF